MRHIVASAYVGDARWLLTGRLADYQSPPGAGIAKEAVLGLLQREL